MKKLLKRKISIILIILHVLVSIGAIAVTMYVDLVPNKYVLAMAAILVFLLAYHIVSQMTNKLYVLGRILSVLFCFVICFGCFYEIRAYSTINNISSITYKTDEISCIVMAENSAQSLQDTSNSTFGILNTLDRTNTDKTIQDVNTKLNKQITTKPYDDAMSLVNALYNSEVQVIVLNESFRDVIKDTYKNFDTETRVLTNHQVQTVIETPKVEKPNSAITKEPFSVYISGIDVKGDITKTSRSDVNIIATINPVSKQILLTSTPRDYYVPTSVSNGVPDKLTHAGLYGIDCSMKTLEKLYGINIDYYARVNFSGLVDIVDTLGGVNVYSDYTFKSDWGPSYKKGYNQVNGKQALAFVRSRHQFATGDRQRGKDQQYMIKAILEKMMTPSIIQNFTSLLDDVQKLVQTNMKTKEITDLAKMQLSDMSKWNIVFQSVDGTGSSKTSYSMPSSNQYVMVPIQSTVDAASKKLKDAIAGKEITSNEEYDIGDSTSSKDDTKATATPKATSTPYKKNY